MAWAFARAAALPGGFPIGVAPGQVPEVFVVEASAFVVTMGGAEFFDPQEDSAPRRIEASKETAPGQKLPADTPSLEVQARAISSCSRESDPPLAHVKTKTVRCRYPARSWPEVILHPIASRQP